LIIQAVGSFPILHGGRPVLLEKLLPAWWRTGNWPPIS